VVITLGGTVSLAYSGAGLVMTSGNIVLGSDSLELSSVTTITNAAPSLPI